MKRIYIGMPVYNGQKYISDAVMSVLGQSHQNWELHCVDDQSSDKTADIIRSFNDARIMYHCNKRRVGLVKNFNRSIELCSDDYIYFFHQDDIMKPDNLEKKVKVLETNPCVGLVHSNIDIIDEKGNFLKGHWNKLPAQDSVVKGEDFFFKMLDFNMVCMPSVLIRSECVKQLGRFDERLHFACDYELWMRIGSKYDIAYLNEPLVQFRAHFSNETLKYSDNAHGVQEERLARIFAIKKTNLYMFLDYGETVTRQKILNEATDSFISKQWIEFLKIIMLYVKHYPRYLISEEFRVFMVNIFSKVTKRLGQKHMTKTLIR